ncbi:MAG: hypothetical protein M3P42_09185 [Actinomycetota bacterium]|nr:hypothetical protein [Actinomycetota bacterium]
MACVPRGGRIEHIREGRGSSMLEWKAWILTLLITTLAVIDQLGIQIDSNWNW